MQGRLAMRTPHAQTQWNCHTARHSNSMVLCEVDARHYLSCNTFKATTIHRHNQIHDVIHKVAECSVPEMDLRYRRWTRGTMPATRHAPLAPDWT
jgi:hypothetical protein